MLYKKTVRKISMTIALVMTLAGAMEGLALADYFLEDGDITVKSDGTGPQTVQQGGTTHNDDAPVITQRDTTKTVSSTVTLIGSNNATANATIKDVNIAADDNTAGIKVEGSAAVTVSGDNKVQGGAHAAGIEVGTGDTLSITDDKSNDSASAANDSLTATAGVVTETVGTGAGIGGANGESGGTVNIDGNVDVTAKGAGSPQKTGASNAN